MQLKQGLESVNGHWLLKFKNAICVDRINDRNGPSVYVRAAYRSAKLLHHDSRLVLNWCVIIGRYLVYSDEHRTLAVLTMIIDAYRRCSQPRNSGSARPQASRVEFDPRELMSVDSAW